MKRLDSIFKWLIIFLLFMFTASAISNANQARADILNLKIEKLACADCNYKFLLRSGDTITDYFNIIGLLNVTGNAYINGSLYLNGSLIDSLSNNVTTTGIINTSELNINNSIYHGNLFSAYFDEAMDALRISFNNDENSPQITTDSNYLVLNPYYGVVLPEGKSIRIGNIDSFKRLFFTMDGSDARITSSDTNLIITSQRYLQFRASNTLFPAPNIYSYFTSSNSARYHEIRAIYGTGTGSTNYAFMRYNATEGGAVIGSGNNALVLKPANNNTIITGNLNVTNNITIGGVGKAGCIQIRDSDDAGWTKCTTLAGVLNCTIGTC
jgi:hypothetical protein